MPKNYSETQVNPEYARASARAFYAEKNRRDNMGCLASLAVPLFGLLTGGGAMVWGAGVVFNQPEMMNYIGPDCTLVPLALTLVSLYAAWSNYRPQGSRGLF